MRSNKYHYIIIILLILSIQIASANSSQSGNIIYINDRQNLTQVSVDINNVSALQNLDGNWILNADLINNKTDNTFYINESDVYWLKLNSTGTSCAYYATIGKTEINNTKITSWNTTSNNVEMEVTRNSCRSYIYASGSNSKMNISNSNVSYLGYLLYEWYFGTTWYSSNNNSIYNNTFIGNYRGVVLNSASYNTVSNNYFENVQYASGTTTEYTGVYIYRSLSTHNNVSNNTIILHNQQTTLNEVNMGLFIWGGIYNHFYNNNIWSDADGYGIYMKSNANNNNFNNNIINYTGSSSGSTRGIYIYSSKYNTILNGLVYTPVNDYYLQSSDSSNIFNLMNFDNGTIYFYDAISFFNYSHDNNTILISKANKKNQIKRSIYNWNLNEVLWSDKSSVATTIINYTMYGLYNNTLYNIYINEQLEHEFTTNGEGMLPPFEILMNSTKRIQIVRGN